MPRPLRFHWFLICAVLGLLAAGETGARAQSADGGAGVAAPTTPASAASPSGPPAAPTAVSETAVKSPTAGPTGVSETPVNPSTAGSTGVSETAVEPSTAGPTGVSGTAGEPPSGAAATGVPETAVEPVGEHSAAEKEAIAQPEPPPTKAPSSGERAWVVIKVIIGLSILVVLAFLGGHPGILRLERTLGISQVVTAGFPFVALGLIARQESIGVLSDSVLLQLEPLLHFGLGWLGFMVGFRLDLPTLDKVPRGTALMVAVEASAPFAVIAVASAAVMLAFRGELTDAIIRDAIVLGAAGAMTAPRVTRGLAERLRTQRDDPDVLIGQLDEIAGIIGLLFLAAFFRPTGPGVSWVLPPVGWIFITLGAGVALGVLMYAVVQAAKTPAEFLASTLGFIAFASGIGGFLHLSPIVVCFVAGAIVGNFPTEHRRQLWATFATLERPINLVFLMVVGAVWQVGDWRGWVLLVVFVGARLGGKAIGLIAARNALKDVKPVIEEQRVIVTPLSMLALAIVVSVQSLYHGDSIAWIVTAVLGGAVVCEMLVAIFAPPVMRRVPVPLPHTSVGPSESAGAHGASEAEPDPGAGE